MKYSMIKSVLKKKKHFLNRFIYEKEISEPRLIGFTKHLTNVLVQFQLSSE